MLPPKGSGLSENCSSFQHSVFTHHKTIAEREESVRIYREFITHKYVVKSYLRKWPKLNRSAMEAGTAANCAEERKRRKYAALAEAHQV